MEQFVDRQVFTRKRAQTRELVLLSRLSCLLMPFSLLGLTYRITEPNGDSPMLLYINRKDATSLPLPGEEAKYVNHVILVAGVKKASFCFFVQMLKAYSVCSTMVFSHHSMKGLPSFSFLLPLKAPTLG